MAVILLGYFSTMVTVLAVLVFLLNGFLGAVTYHAARGPSHLAVAFAHTRANFVRANFVTMPKPQQVAQVAADPVSPAAAHQASAIAVPSKSPDRTAAKAVSAQKAPVRIARSQKRNERIASRRQERERTLALGYAPESRERLAAATIFGNIGQPRGF